MRERILNVATIVAAAGCVGIVVLAAWNGLSAREGNNVREVRQVDRWRAIEATGTLIGPPGAPVRITVFSDFQCPFCAKAMENLGRIRDRHPGQVAVVYRHLPLEEIHPHALAAALASECAAEQGRFEAFHDVLYGDQGRIGIVSWTELAKDAAVPDTLEFQGCLFEERHRERVAMDVDAAASIGVAGTPTFIVEGRMISGAETGPQLNRWVREALEEHGTAPR